MAPDRLLTRVVRVRGDIAMPTRARWRRVDGSMVVPPADPLDDDVRLAGVTQQQNRRSAAVHLDGRRILIVYSRWC
jgi:hypothetical protein